MTSSNVIAAKLSEKWTGLKDYARLKTMNDSLAEENERLKNALEIYRRDNIPPIEKSGFEFIAAKVVGATINRTKNFLTINKGEFHNIEPQMGVIGPNGIVGIVYTSTGKYSSVLPVINPETKISVKFDKNDHFGSLSWDGFDIRTATLTGIPGYTDVKEGDLIVTSGLSSIFPDKIPVGEVKSFIKDEATDFYTIKVELFTDFSNISYVYVIRNLNYLEQEQYNNNIDD